MRALPRVSVALFSVVALVEPVAFYYAGGETGDPVENLLYYSFVTLTTLGYGDITPIHPVARTLAYLEAVIGQLYIAVLIASLVGRYLVGGSFSAATVTTPVSDRSL